MIIRGPSGVWLCFVGMSLWCTCRSQKTISPEVLNVAFNIKEKHLLSEPFLVCLCTLAQVVKVFLKSLCHWSCTHLNSCSVSLLPFVCPSGRNLLWGRSYIKYWCAFTHSFLQCCAFSIVWCWSNTCLQISAFCGLLNVKLLFADGADVSLDLF